MAWYIGIAGHHDTRPQIHAAPILSHKISANTKKTHCIIVDIFALTFIDKIYTNCAWQMHKIFTAEGLFLKQSPISILD